MQNDKQKRLKIQQGVISVTCMAMIVFVFTWLINTAVTGRKNGLYPGERKNSQDTGASVSSADSESEKISQSKPSKTASSAADGSSSDSSSESEEKPYEGAAMKDDFSDACFIGDSRTVGLEMNSDKAKADFYASQGLNITTAMTDTFVTLDNGNLGTVVDGAAQKPYKRIFIMFGINELGWPYPENFVSQYVDLVNAVKEVRPDAKVYIQSILPVSYKAAETNEVFTNTNIDSFNDYVKQVAEQTDSEYLDINKYFKDSTGSLPEDAAADGIHFVRSYCLEWIDILAYLVPQDSNAAAEMAEAETNERSSDTDQDTQEDSYSDEAIGEYGFTDPNEYDTGTDDNAAADDGYDGGQTDQYGGDDYGYTYDDGGDVYTNA